MITYIWTGPWTLKNYPKLLSFGYIRLYFLPSVVAISISIFVILSSFFSNRLRLWISRIFGAILFVAGLLFAVAFVRAIPFMIQLAMDDIVPWHQGTGSYLVHLAHSLLGVGGFFMLFKSATAEPKPSKVKQQDQPQALTSLEREGLRQRKPTKQQATNAGAPSQDDHIKPTYSGYSKNIILLAFLTIILCGGFLWSLSSSVNYLDKCSVDVSDIKVPPGFHVEAFAERVPEARSMALSPSGILFVGTRKAGSFHAVVDLNKDNKADLVLVLGTGMVEPNGIAFKDGSLYVAEISRIWRYPKIEEALAKIIPTIPKNTSFVELPKESLQRELLTDNLPDSPLHGWRYIAFGPDGLLYMAVGSPCNVCYRENPIYSTIIRQSSPTDWTNWDIYAEGVRNSLGFDWHPKTNELWFTENGRDFADHDYPPDELNVAPKKGLHFGFPWCYGAGVEDTDVQKNYSVYKDCSQFENSKLDLQPHAAALGMRFYRGQMFPAEYHHAILIAEHGSWNRPPPITGYRVSMARLLPTGSLSYEEFMGGFVRKDSNFLISEQGCGRPVDIVEMPDGSLLVSDDHNSRIYRITYKA